MGRAGGLARADERRGHAQPGHRHEQSRHDGQRDDGRQFCPPVARSGRGRRFGGDGAGPDRCNAKARTLRFDDEPERAGGDDERRGARRGGAKGQRHESGKCGRRGYKVEPQRGTDWPRFRAGGAVDQRHGGLVRADQRQPQPGQQYGDAGTAESGAGRRRPDARRQDDGHVPRRRKSRAQRVVPGRRGDELVQAGVDAEDRAVQFSGVFPRTGKQRRPDGYGRQSGDAGDGGEDGRGRARQDRYFRAEAGD